MSKKPRSLIICLTALNYVYAFFDPNLGEHDVICDNHEVADWIKINFKGSFREIYVLKIHNKIFLKNHINSSSENIYWDKLRRNKFDRIYLSFSSGWHLNWLQKRLNINIEDCIILDDGTSNLLINKTNYYPLKKILSIISSGRFDSFSRYRDFNNKKVKQIISIYNNLEIERLNVNYSVIEIQKKLSKYCLSRRESNKVILNKPYGVYMTSDRGAYYKDSQKIINEIRNNLDKLKKKTNIDWILKTKRTDPLKALYLENNFKVVPFTINQELMLDMNLKYICTNYDSFLLNKNILKLPVNIIVRENEKTLEKHSEKVAILKRLTEDAKNILI